MKRICVYLFVLLVAVVGCILLDADYGKWLTAGASAFSIVGVVISLFEIVGVKSKTRAVGESLSAMRKEINSFYSYSEINEMARMIDGIESYLRNNNLDGCHVMMKDLKSKLIVQSENWKRNADDKELVRKMKNCLIDLGVDIKSVYSSLTRGSALDDEIVMTHLEDIKEQLNEKAGQIKSEKL